MAKNIKQEGQIVGDKATSVKLRVKVTGGQSPRRSAASRPKRRRSAATSGPDRIDFTALTPVNVNSNNTFKVRLSDGDGGILRISGKVKNGGKATVGNLKTNDFKSGKQTCKAPKQKFKTSA